LDADQGKSREIAIEHLIKDEGSKTMNIETGKGKK